MPVAAQDAPAPAPRTTLIGRRDSEVILAKLAVTDLLRSYRLCTEAVGIVLPSPK